MESGHFVGVAFSHPPLSRTVEWKARCSGAVLGWFGCSISLTSIRSLAF